MFISPMLLDKIYVRGSLKNTDTGFSFQLKNVVDSGTMAGIKALVVDGVDVPVEGITVRTQAGEKKAGEISFRAPVPLRYGAEATLVVEGQQLPAGEHNVVLTLSVVEIGKIELKFKDEIQ